MCAGNECTGRAGSDRGPCSPPISPIARRTARPRPPAAAASRCGRRCADPAAPRAASASSRISSAGQPQTRLPRQQRVVGVARLQLRPRVRRLPVRRRRDDQPDHLLHAPAARHEFRGQPVEQFRMRRAARPACRNPRTCVRCRGRTTPATNDSRPPAPSADCRGDTSHRASRSRAGSGVTGAAAKPTGCSAALPLRALASRP